MYGSEHGGAVVKKVTVPDIRARKGAGPPLAVITAYDYTMARLADEAGLDIVLVGDSLGMVVQGGVHTLAVTVEDICYHGRAVSRGVARAHIVGDMPFMSYQVSASRAIESAGRLVKEGACESVKVEGGEEVARHVARVVRAGIPVMGHVGLQPQRVHELGGFRIQGRGVEAAERIVRDAQTIEAAGAYAIVLEAVPPDVAEEVTHTVRVPTIGIGAGPACDGQVLVSTDLLGMTRGHSPKFAKRYAELGDAIVAAMRHYANDVRARAFPSVEHSFRPNEPGDAGRLAPENEGDQSVAVGGTVELNH